MFKILGWILLVLLILLIVLLHFSVVIRVHAGRDGFRVTMKYLILTLYPRKKKKEEPEDEAFDVLSDDLTDEELMQGLTEQHEAELIQQAEKPGSKPESVKEDKKEESHKPSENKDKKEKKESKKEDSKPSETVSEPDEEPEPEEKKEKKSLRDKIAGIRAKYEKFKPYIPMSWTAFKRLCKAVRISVDDLWVNVGRDDAHEAAIFYGSIQAAIGTTLAECAKWFTLRVKRWDVNCRFAENIIEGGTDVSVRVRPSTLIGILFLLGVNFLYVWIKGKIARKRAAKKAAQTNNGSAEPTA